MWTQKDRRIFDRIEGELAVRYSPQGSDREFCTTTKNISGNGVRMALLKKLSPGTILDLEMFTYKTDMMTRCRGRVVWVWDNNVDTQDEQLYEAGIKFIDNPFLYIGKLINYLETQKKSD